MGHVAIQVARGSHFIIRAALRQVNSDRVVLEGGA